MNSIIKEAYPMFEMYQALRNQLMEILTDEDLSFQPSSANPTLGALCKQIGETEIAYIESFKTFRQDFSYRNEEPGLEHSVARLREWLAALDQTLKTTIEGLSEEDINNRVIERGPEFKLPPRIQLDIYNEALLIFYGKVSVYLHAMGKTMPQQWQEWIG